MLVIDGAGSATNQKVSDAWQLTLLDLLAVQGVEAGVSLFFEGVERLGHIPTESVLQRLQPEAHT